LATTKENARRKRMRAGSSEGIAKTRSGSTPEQIKKMAKPEAEKKLNKAGKHKLPKAKRRRAVYAADYGLMTAFHHMQRASVVMSLMEEGTGEDLRDLLKLGVKLYRKAVEDNAKNKVVLQAIGVLRASEHLSMAGLYAARAKHKQKVMTPTPEWLAKAVGETSNRMGRIEQEERGKGKNLVPVTVELLRQAGDRDHDAQLAFELAMAADALCFALENGL